MTGHRILLVSDHGRVRRLELNRPEKRNALSGALRRELVDALASAESDDGVGAVLLCGAGEAFCAGFDLSELAAAPDPAGVLADSRHYHRCVHTFPKPLIAAVGGAAVAGGFDLSLMCDVRIASHAATFGQPQVLQGIPASYELMAHVIGVPAARDLCLTGRIIDAGEALELGFVTRLVPAHGLLAAAAELAERIADGPGARHAKKQFVAEQPRLFDGDGA